jgi:hypothetical protein
MLRVFLIGSVVLVSISAAAEAQTFNFDEAAYVTCREAQEMPPATRRALAIFLAEHAAHNAALRFPRTKSARRSAIWFAAAVRSRPTPTCSQ